jgi:hypothetical protein
MKESAGVGKKRIIDHFKAFYGVCPETLVLFFGDLFKKHPSLKYKDVFMTIYWLKTYSIAHVTAAAWGRCEDYINPVLEEYIAKFDSYGPFRGRNNHCLFHRRMPLYGR